MLRYRRIWRNPRLDLYDEWWSTNRTGWGALFCISDSFYDNAIRHDSYQPWRDCQGSEGRASRGGLSWARGNGHSSVQNHSRRTVLGLRRGASGQSVVPEWILEQRKSL